MTDGGAAIVTNIKSLDILVTLDKYGRRKKYITLFRFCHVFVIVYDGVP
jgi:hypothetical protein